MVKATPDIRNRIVADWLNGTATQAALAEQHGLSTSYVGRIIVDAVPAKARRQRTGATRRRPKIQAVLAALTDDQIADLNRSCSSIDQIAKRIGVSSITPSDEYAVWLERRFDPCGIVARRPPAVTDREQRVLEAARRIVADIDGPITPRMYRHHPVADIVSISTVYKTLRANNWEWGDLMVAVGGVRPRPATGGRPRTVTAADATAAISTYLDNEDGRPTVDGYVAWRSDHPNGGLFPCYSSILTALDVRTWRQVIQRCRPDRLDPGKVPSDA